MPPSNSHRWSVADISNGRTVWSCSRCKVRVDTSLGQKPSSLIAGRVLNGTQKLKARQPLPTCVDASGNLVDRKSRTKLRHDWSDNGLMTFEGREWKVWRCSNCPLEIAVPPSATGYTGCSRRYRHGPDRPWVYATHKPLPVCEERKDILFLRKFYEAKGSAYCAKKMKRPQRRVIALANKLGLRRYKPWTDHERGILQYLWGSVDPEAIAKRVDHTRQSVCNEAERLKLGIGCPNGWEYVTSAARRAGFSIPLMRAVLKRANVRVKASITREKRSGKVGRWIVLSEDVDEAIEEWMKCENPGTFAEKNGMNLRTLEKWLARIGVVRSPKQSIRTWMVPSTDLDKALAERAAHESVGAYAVRRGFQQGHVELRLRATGHVRPNRGSKEPWLLPTTTLDAVMESYESLCTPTGWAKEHGRDAQMIANHLRAAGLAPGPHQTGQWWLPRAVIDEVMSKVVLKPKRRSPTKKTAVTVELLGRGCAMNDSGGIAQTA